MLDKPETLNSTKQRRRINELVSF